MQDEFQLRQEIVRIGKLLHNKGFLAGNDGNNSCRIERDKILITPSGRPKGMLEPDELVVLDMGGSKLMGTGAPSSEYKMHLAIYNNDHDAMAVVHAHPPVTTAFSVAGKHFHADILPEGVIVLDNIAWIEYATPSTDDLPRLMEAHLPGSDIFVLKQHGVTSSGTTLEEAYLKIETCEHQALVYFYASLLGTPNRLKPDEVEKIRTIFGKKG
jgi:L-fuculose-phosphate aldolase